MRFSVRHYLELLSLPLTFLVVSITLRLIWHIFSLPEAAVLAEMVGGWLYTYGAPIIFISAVFEGMLLVGGYFPGIFIIALSVLAARSPWEAAWFVAIGSAGLLVAHVANYLLGRYGWYRLLARFGLMSSITQARTRLTRRGPIAIFSSYWMPSLAALVDTAAGIMHIPFRRFFLWSLAGVVFWDTLVGTIIYFLGDQVFAVISPGGTDIRLILAIIVVWSLILIIYDRWRGSTSSSA